MEQIISEGQGWDVHSAKDIPDLDISSFGMLCLTSQDEIIALTFLTFLYLVHI